MYILYSKRVLAGKHEQIPRQFAVLYTCHPWQEGIFDRLPFTVEYTDSFAVCSKGISKQIAAPPPEQPEVQENI
jgi:hypothetical protein